MTQPSPATPADRPPAVPTLATAARSERTRRLLEDPILPTLLRLAVPTVVVVVVQVASSTVDALFVARLGTDALAGVSLVFPVWMLMITMSGGAIGGGIGSAIARALGAGRREEAGALAAHAIAISLGLSALFTVGALTAGPPLYRALGGADATLAAAVAYSTIVFAGAAAVWLVNALASALRGAGEMVPPAVVIVAGELIHIALAPVLIFGLGPIPALGVAGAALSLVCSYLLRAAALAAYVAFGRAAVRPTFGATGIRRALVWEILRVGLPSALNTILTNLNVLAVTGLVGSFGTAALAGYGVGARLEYLQIPLVFGLGTALVTLVGANVGAGALARARRAAWLGAGLAAGVTGSVGLLVAGLPQAWIGLFSDQPAVLAAGQSYLRIVGPTYGLFGLGFALYFAAQGAGRLLWPLLAGVLRLIIAAGGGWVAVAWLGGDLTTVFVIIALSFVAFGAGQAVAIRRALKRR